MAAQTPPRSDALVLFGVSGDLAFKKIFPALLGMAARTDFNTPIIGVARAGWTLAQLQLRVYDSLIQRGPVDAATWAKLKALLIYVDGDYHDAQTYQLLRAALGGAQRPLHYLAIPPSLFPRVIEGLLHSNCAVGARVVVEKPFGRDLASASALNHALHEVFDESAVFRIDHYLGKEAVQNLLYFRFANSFLEPIWNHYYIDHVQITLAEQFGVEGRGAFYDEVGTIRDVVQNHLLQVVALLAMDVPVGRDAEAMHAERLRVFRAMRPLDPATAVRGQFDGYCNEPGVAADSQIETYVAMCLYIDTWRWAGVPFYLRAGKKLALTATEVTVTLKRPPLAIFDEPALAAPNYFRFRLSPEVVIATGARVKHHGDTMRGDAVELVARNRPGSEKSPYERLLSDALRGDPTLFTRDDSVEAAWRVVAPLLGNQRAPERYVAGSWGPAAAAQIASCEGGWRDPIIEHTAPC